jgi:hypothetical protein
MSSPGPNPYAPPKAPIQPLVTGLGELGACPRCEGSDLHKPTFTWWGGALGPKLFKHTVCRGCGLGFNWKTGKSNATAIGIYLGVGVVLGVVLIALRVL